MNFEIIPIDDFKRGFGNAGSPKISFSLSGSIRISMLSIKKMLPTCLENDKEVYIHFMSNKDKELFVKMDYEEKNGVRIRFDGLKGGVTRDQSDNIVGQGSLVVKHLASVLDWPLEKGKLRVIKYELGDEIEAGIYKCS
jgi:hypothetical protein